MKRLQARPCRDSQVVVRAGNKKMQQVNSHKRQVRLRPSSNYFLFLFLPFFLHSDSVLYE
jgi:hypothetical protein